MIFIASGLKKISTLSFLFSILLAVAGLDSNSQGANSDRKVCGLKVSTVTLSRLDINWDAVKDATGYNVYRSSSIGQVKYFSLSDDNLIASTTKTKLVDRELTPSKTYHYKVTALFGKKEGEPSEVASGTTKHKDLAMSYDGSRLIVEGDAFKITFDGDKGGEITEIKQYDGLNWVVINSKSETIPGYLINDTESNSFQLCNASGVDFQIVKNTPDEIVFCTKANPQTKDGKVWQCEIKQTFTVFKEGNLFCSFDIILPKNSMSLYIDYAELGFELDQALTSNKFMWGYYTRNNWALQTQKTISDSVKDKSMYPYVAIDYGLGSKTSFTNHLAFFIEDWKALGSTAKENSGCEFGKNRQGNMEYKWILYNGKKNRLRPGYTYSNTWGMGFGAMRKSSRSNISASRGNNLIGMRYYHTHLPTGHPVGESPDDWPWFLEPRWSKPLGPDIFPSNAEIDKIAKLGANVFIMHQQWMKCGGSNTWPPASYTPKDPAELKRVIDRCHANGMRVGLYMRSTECYSLYSPFFENFLQYDFDGLYVDWNTPLWAGVSDLSKKDERRHYSGYFRASETHFDAYSYFRYQKMLRKRVGEKGFMISHCGANVMMTALSVFDCYLPGEYSDQQKHLLESPDLFVYYGLGTSCGTAPIDYTTPRKKAIAYCAGVGGWISAGPKTFERNGYDSLAVLWQIWKSVPMEKAYFYNNLTENVQVVSSSDPDFYSCVYKIDRDLALVTTSNFGERAGTTLSLDMPTLGLVGEYEITEMSGKDYDNYKVKKIGSTNDCVIKIEPIDQYEIRGYKLERTKKKH